MKLSYNKKSKDPIYYIQHGFRNGKKTTTKNVARIGKHSELLAITDDPLAYAQEQVKLYNEEHKKGKLPIKVNVDFSQSLKNNGDTASHSTSKNIGYFYLQAIYQKLELKQFFTAISKQRKITYDCNEINRFLTFGRILDPRSKRGTYDRLDSFFEKPNFEYHHIMRFLDVLADNYNEYLSHLFKTSSNVVDRNTSVCYYDCTNYYFEIEEADEEYIDEVTGEIITGLRQYGVSKENRPNPIVQMGLFMDGNGIPISMAINPGNQNEQTGAIPAEEQMIKMFDKKSDFIYCADAGLSSIRIKEFNNKCNRKFIVTQSIKGTKVPQPVTEAALNGIDYKLISNGSPASLVELQSFDRKDPENRKLYDDLAFKIIPVEYDIDTGILETGTENRKKKVKGKFKTNLIVTFSRKTMEYQRYIRNKQIQRAERLVNNNKVDASKKGPHDVKRFIKKDKVTVDGKVIDNKYEIDYDRIHEEEKYDGFYAIATNFEITTIDEVREILNINKRHYKIEDCFRVMKTSFKARPIYHQKDNHIKAHFLVCYTALLIYRLLEVLLDENGSHFTTDNILETLRNMNVENIHDLFYKACYSGSDVLTALNQVIPIDLDKTNYETKDMNKKIKKLLH